MNTEEKGIFTAEVKRLIKAATDHLSRDFRLNALQRAEAKANIMLYLWRNAQYYDPTLSEWKTFATLVVSSGTKRERMRLTKEANLEKIHVPLDTEPDDARESNFARCRTADIDFAIDFAEVLSRMPPRSAEILHSVVAEGLSLKEAACRFGFSQRAFYRRAWPRVQKDFLRLGGEFLLSR